MNETYLRKIAIRATTLREHLEKHLYLEREDKWFTNGEERLLEWIKTVGDEERFEERLAKESIDSQIAYQILAIPDHETNVPLPDWVNVLFKVIKEVDKSTSLDRSIENTFPIPYEHLLLPFVIYGRKQLSKRCQESLNLLSDKAQVALERDLLAQLSWLSARCFHLEFLVFRKSNEYRNSIHSDLSSAPDALYLSFIESLQNNEYRNFFLEYSALARLLVNVANNWINAHEKFLMDLNTDYVLLNKRFSESVQLGKVVAIEPSKSDPHNGGRKVLILTFENSRKVVYKPRPLGAEAALQTLFKWLNTHGLSPTMKTIVVESIGDHGWVEFVQHLPCQNSEQVKRYFQRAGILLCILNTLRGGDYHNQNLIAHGEYPIPVDCEVLFEPLLDGSARYGGDDAFEAALEFFYSSVVNTGLLPVWREVDKGISQDASGLGGVGGQITKRIYPKWDKINTDMMELLEIEENSQTKRETNEVYLNGKLVQAQDYGHDIEDGFRTAYTLILNHKRKFLDSNAGPVASFLGTQLRYVFRNTRLYYGLLYTSCIPKYLRVAVDRSIHFELLCRGLLTASKKTPQIWSLLSFEQKALEYADIPLFSFIPESKLLYCNKEVVTDGIFARTGYELVIERITSMGDSDFQQQIAFIRSSLLTRLINEGHSFTQFKANKLEDSEKLSDEDLLQSSIEIANLLKERAIIAEDTATWIGINYDPSIDRYRVRPLSFDFYSGLSGIAVFLYALFYATQNKIYHDLARKSLQPISNKLSDESERQLLSIFHSVGGAAGLASIAYAYGLAYRFTDNEEYLHSARIIGQLITPKKIRSDEQFDIVSGCAGAILGFLSLYEITKEPLFLDICLGCGEHLANNMTTDRNGERAWKWYRGDRMLTGFSHGAAGIAYSLFKLGNVLNEPIFIRAATAGFNYERSVFSDKLGNWPDFRHEQPAYMSSWCHGAPGIVLSRLGCLRFYDEQKEAILNEIEYGINTTVETLTHKPDHLCCGVLGRAEVLLVAAKQLHKPHLASYVYSAVSTLVAESRLYGGYLLHSKMPRGTFVPSFFQGLAGIGYEYLRVWRPDLIPSVLLWD